LILTLTSGCGLALAACAPSDPPTITPPPATLPALAPGAGTGPEGSQSIVVTMPPPQVPSGSAEPVVIDAVTAYQDAAGKFSLDVPVAWTESRKTAELTGDAKLGTVFSSPNKNGILSITHFDNGKVPESLGGTANGVMKLTRITEEPGFQELNRAAVLDRPGQAMVSEVTYTRRSSGIPMHGLLLFQIDGTNFTMLHIAVEQSSWVENESQIRDIVASYRGPSAAP